MGKFGRKSRGILRTSISDMANLQESNFVERNFENPEYIQFLAANGLFNGYFIDANKLGVRSKKVAIIDTRY